LGRHPTQAWHYLGSDVNRKWKLIEKYTKKKGLSVPTLYRWLPASSRI
jgi:hypothetical protein